MSEYLDNSLVGVVWDVNVRHRPTDRQAAVGNWEDTLFLIPYSFSMCLILCVVFVYIGISPLGIIYTVADQFDSQSTTAAAKRSIHFIIVSRPNTEEQ